MKRFFTLFCILTLVFLLAGCNSDSEYQKQQLQLEIESLQKEADSLKSDINDLQQMRDGLISKEDYTYVIEVTISQTHLTLDIGELLKDSLNEIVIPIEVSQEYYYSVEIGDTLADDFRIGSFIFKGSFGNWNVVVSDKQAVSK